ncbi:MAG: putative beta-lysine N-acetyltransferase [Firmicutes bacterium]|nr:putative beta-lysine N-acetyltransferase [Bacillota bacterium]
MDIIDLTLNKGKTTTIHGKLYGLMYEIEEKDYYLRLFIDYFNRRLKVLDYSGSNYEDMTKRIDYITKENNFDKVFIKGTSDDWEEFMSFGYVLEGIFKYYYYGEHGYCLSKFYTNQRRNSGSIEKENDILEKVRECGKKETKPLELSDDYIVRVATEKDIDKITKLYDKVFKTYPIPLNDKNYVKTLMDSDVLFILIEHKGKLISAASADMNHKYKNAEMTDCATDPDYRGKGLMSFIIKKLEKEMKKRSIVCLYSLARAVSFGMNKVFKKHGYTYTGRLINNCNICGNFEDMNLWVKQL